jgi:AcrR family transcriptional regulator
VERSRKDARTNRARILEVADEVFGRGGETASTEEVARLARVGIATVFRHFPTKASLLEAVLVARLDRLRCEAEALADAEDAGRAFYDFFRYMVEDAATKIAISEALLDTGAVARGDGGPAERSARALRREFGVLLSRAQRAGGVRDDIELPELYALLVGASRAAAYAKLDAEVRARSLAILFDGLAPR